MPILASRAARRCAPPPVAQALAALLGTTPEAVRRVAVCEHSLYARLHGRRCAATTRRGAIYLAGSAEGFFADGELVLHEYFHVMRQWGTGELSLARYLMESLRRGYRRNAYEVAARRFAARELPRYRSLLPR